MSKVTKIEQEYAKRNKEKIDRQITIFSSLRLHEQAELFKYCKIVDDTNKECKLTDIDFNNSVVFISEFDFSSLIPYYALLRINNAIIPDYTFNGRNSIINKDAIIVDSHNIKHTKLPKDSFYDIKRNKSMPDSWDDINIELSDVLIWRLDETTGLGDAKKMYNCCNSWVSSRYRRGKIDWLFYFGSLENFIDEYTVIYGLGLPIYKIILKNKYGAALKRAELTKNTDELSIIPEKIMRAIKAASKRSDIF